MHRIDGPGATVDNEFTEGNPATSVPATVVTDDWLNDVQEELISILTAGGVTPVKGTQNQVLNSIVPALIASIAEAQGLTINTKLLTPGRLADAFKGGNQALTAAGYQKLPGGIIFQWKLSGSIPAGTAGNTNFPIAFPSGCLFCTAAPQGSSASGTPGNIVAGPTSPIGVNLYNWGTISAPALVLAIGV